MNIKIKLEFYLKAMLGSPRGNQSAPVTGEPTRRQLRREWTASRLITSGRRTRKTLGMLQFFFYEKILWWYGNRESMRRTSSALPLMKRSSTSMLPSAAQLFTLWMPTLVCSFSYHLGGQDWEVWGWTRLGGMRVIWESCMRWYKRWYRRWYSRWYMMWYKRWYEREQTHSLVSSLSYNLGGKDCLPLEVLVGWFFSWMIILSMDDNW